MLVMCIPDTARLSITARVADSALQNMALTVGTQVQPAGTAQVTAAITADSAQLTLPDAAPAAGDETAFAYITGSTGADAAALRAQSGKAYTVSGGVVQDFTATPGTTYFVRYTRAVAGGSFSIPALFAPRVVRAHFAVNVYAKQRGCDLLASALVMRRHYHIPCYCFTGALADSLSQTDTGSVDLSGLCLTSEGSDGSLTYGTVVDEPLDGAGSFAVHSLKGA